MEKIEGENKSKWIETFEGISRNVLMRDDVVNPSFDDFKSGCDMYHKYMGCGNHLYLLVKEGQDETTVTDIASKRVHSLVMADELREVVDDDFRLVQIDVEMGGMFVHENFSKK